MKWRLGNSMRAPTLAIIFAMTVVGCANWQPESLTKQPFTFPRNRPALDTVGIEVAVAEVSHDQLATLEAFWRTLDAQELPLETRQKLDRNGLRCGIMSTQPSADFQELVKPRLPDLDTLDEVGKRMAAAGRIPPVSPLLLHQRVSNQEAQRYPVGVSKIHDSWNRPVSDHGNDTAEFLHDARGFFDLTTYAQPDGSIQLRVAPTLQHGDARSSIEVVEGSFVMDRAQQRTTLDDLTFQLQLCVGETLVVAATPPNDTPGADLMASDRPLARRVLLVRLTQTQMDDLFDRTASDQ